MAGKTPSPIDVDRGPRRGAPILLLAAFSIALVASRASALAFDPFLSPSPEPPDAPGVVAATNDSFGPGPVDEWDDLDSFGLRLALPLGGGRFLAAISGLTDRTIDASDANRIDEASAGAAFSVFACAPVWLTLAAGFDATGNFGGLEVQEGIHTASGVNFPRSVPTAYSGSFALAPLGAFKLLVGTETPVSPYLVIAGRASLAGSGSLLAVAGVRYSRPGALLAAGGGWRWAGSIAPGATIAALDAAEDGPYLGFELRVGLLALAFEDIPLLKKTNGSLGFAFGGPAPLPPGARSLSLDLGLLTGSSVAQRVHFDAGLIGSLRAFHANAFLSLAQGWFPSDHLYGTDTLFWEYSAGGAVSLPLITGLLHACLGLGPFLSFEQLSTAMLIRSTPVADRMTAGLALEAGLRAALPVESVPLGAGIRIRWRVFQATIKQTGDPFTERNSLDLEFFIFSEG